MTKGVWYSLMNSREIKEQWTSMQRLKNKKIGRRGFLSREAKIEKSWVGKGHKNNWSEDNDKFQELIYQL